MHSYRELLVWQKAIELVDKCYRFAATFPDREKYGLTSQLQRAAVSVPANIAEGHGRGSTGAFLNHLWIANGSLTELETLIVIARRLDYGDDGSAETLLESTQEIGRMLVGLRRSLESHI